MTRHAFVFVPVALGMVALAALGARKTRAQSRAGRTAWGDPDLQGVWSSATITPLERPVALAGTRPF